MKVENKINIIFFIISIYYIPYVTNSWAGAAGVRESSVPIFYKVFQLIIPILTVLFLNFKLKIKSKEVGFISYSLIIVVLLYYLIYFNYFEIEALKLIIFLMLLIYVPNIKTEEITSKSIVILFTICIGSIFLEKNILPQFFNIMPAFFSSWQERYMANMGGPNTLGAFINLVYVFCFYKNILKSKKIWRGVLFVIALWIIRLTDSDGAILVFFITNIIFIFLEKRKLFLGSLYFIIFIILVNLKSILKLVSNKIFIFLEDGSNIDRIVSLGNNLDKIEIIRFREGSFIFLESPYFQIIINYGLLGFVLFLMLLIFIYIFEILNCLDRELKKMKNIIYFQMLIYSLVLPVIYIFPLNILYILIIKLKK